ncbi:MAG TPA: hypothetical protein DEP72_08500 [Clostridiales bacterium]|nr:MAG: hypothetical protein A2Y18_07315 [Clostridiales bacterium GWD2_32_19]HCC08177.1 hypothetical protein [Clostridiales bacterium]
MINVALVSHSHHLHGAERSLLSLAELFYRKFGITLFNNNNIHPILMIPALENGKMASIAQKSGYEVVYTPPNPWYIYKSPKNAQEFDIFCESIREDTKTFINLFKEAKADIVIVNTLTNFIPHIAAFTLNLPIISWICGVLEPAFIPEIDATYQSFIDRTIINLSSKVVMNSNWTEKRFEHITDKNNVITIQNYAFEPSVSMPYNEAINNFICLNSFDPKKGNNILVDAVKIIKDKGIKTHVNLYGNGYESQNLSNQISELEINDYVSINPPTENVSKLYNDCSALIQPSFYESFGRTNIEAMAHKRPVIAANTADPEDIVQDGKTGFHFEQGNSEELALKMIYILNNKNKAKAMGEAGYKVYKTYFDGKVAKKKITDLIYSLYRTQTKHTLMQQYAFDTLKLVHKQ